jgi:hypothetical protein
MTEIAHTLTHENNLAFCESEIAVRYGNVPFNDIDARQQQQQPAVLIKWDELLNCLHTKNILARPSPKESHNVCM